MKENMTNPTNPTNYHALGEVTAFTAQARDAANRLFATLHNAGTSLQHLAHKPDALVDFDALRQQLDVAEQAQREMRAALDRANQAAALCGMPERHLASLRRD